MNTIIFSLVSLIFNLYIWALLLRILLQIIRADYFNPLSQIVIKLTDKPCKILERIIPRHSEIDTAAVGLAVLVAILKLIVLISISDASLTILGVVTGAFCVLLSALLNLYFYLIILVVIASWIATPGYNPLLNVLHKLTAPILNLARRVIPPIAGIDFSPMVVLLLIKIVDLFVLLPMLRLDGAGL